MRMNGDDLLKNIPPAERKIRKRLGEALIRFAFKVCEPATDDVLRRHLTENFRLEVERAAKKGIEVPLAWHSLGTWTEDGRERIGYFSRALECIESGREAHLEPRTPLTEWSRVHSRADCLYEIGRVHAHEGDAAVARDFLMRALPLAQEAERLREPAGVATEDLLEGKIAELLVQLPDEARAE